MTVTANQDSTDPLSKLHHDLRGCLFTLSGGARILRSRGGNLDEHEQVLTYMEESGRKAEKLLAELVEYKRKQTGNATFDVA